jgi:hypothetical protein
MSIHDRRIKHNITQKLLTENAEFPQCHNLRMREEAHFVPPCLMRATRPHLSSRAAFETLITHRTASYSTCESLRLSLSKNDGGPNK